MSLTCIAWTMYRYANYKLKLMKRTRFFLQYPSKQTISLLIFNCHLFSLMRFQSPEWSSLCSPNKGFLLSNVIFCSNLRIIIETIQKYTLSIEPWNWKDLYYTYRYLYIKIFSLFIIVISDLLLIHMHIYIYIQILFNFFCIKYY